MEYNQLRCKTLSLLICINLHYSGIIVTIKLGKFNTNNLLNTNDRVKIVQAMNSCDIIWMNSNLMHYHQRATRASFTWSHVPRIRCWLEVRVPACLLMCNNEVLLHGQYISWQVFVSLEFPSRRQSLPFIFILEQGLYSFVVAFEYLHHTLHYRHWNLTMGCIRHPLRYKF